MSATQIVECWGNMLWDLIYIVGGIVAISAVADFRHAYIMNLTGTPRREPAKLVAEQINPSTAPVAPSPTVQVEVEAE